MAQITQLKRHEVMRFAERFALPDVLSYSPLEGGASNSSYVITTSEGRFVLSVCDEKTLNEIVVNNSLLLNLEEHDFPTTRLCRSTDRQYVLTHDSGIPGPRIPVIMKHYVEGTVPESLNHEMTADLGRWIAKLHMIPSTEGLPESHPYGMDFFSHVTEHHPDDAFSHWLGKQKQKFQEEIPATLQRGLVHGDIFCDNLVYNGDELSAVLDFQEACKYPYVFDIGMAIVGCCDKDGLTNRSAARILINAYESLRPLSSDEKGCIPIMIEYAATSTAFWRYRQYNIRNPDVTKKEHHTKMVKVAEDVSGLTIDKFLA
jgi:homoserine kinase type II